MSGHDTTLFLVGTPLDDSVPLAEPARALLESCELAIGESRARAQRLLRVHQLPEKFVFLDPPSEGEGIAARLTALARVPGARVALFSDCGMPALFDPGREILHRCIDLGYRVRTLGTETSWGTACAASGFLPPFLLYGFLAREKEARAEELRRLRAPAHAIVFLETPYRWNLLLAQLCEAFGDPAPAFVAWEIGRPAEAFWWGTLRELAARAEREARGRGEFVLILAPPTKAAGKDAKPRKR